MRNGVSICVELRKVERLTSFRGEFSILESAGKNPRNGPQGGLETGDGGDMGDEKGLILGQRGGH